MAIPAIPCFGCEYLTAHSRQCRNPDCMTQTTDFLNGLTVTTYPSIDWARSAEGPCGPFAVLREQSSGPSSLPEWMQPTVTPS
jgi:hypothetical protein